MQVCRPEDDRYRDLILRRELATLIQGHNTSCAKIIIEKGSEASAIMQTDQAAAQELWGRCLVGINLCDQQVRLIPFCYRQKPLVFGACFLVYQYLDPNRYSSTHPLCPTTIVVSGPTVAPPPVTSGAAVPCVSSERLWLPMYMLFLSGSSVACLHQYVPHQIAA